LLKLSADCPKPSRFHLPRRQIRAIFTEKGQSAGLGFDLAAKSSDRSLLLGKFGLHVLLPEPESPFSMILEGRTGVQLSLSSVQVRCPGLQPIDQVGGLKT
jgi:hypothetical protein